MSERYAKALCVSRGIFYDHTFRRKDVTAYDKRRTEMKEHIQTGFDESQQTAKWQNVLQRQFHVDKPNRVWVSDVTCFKVNGKYLYVCVILDLFSRKVVAYRVSPKNSTYLIASTFRLAFQIRNSPVGPTFRNDQGTQYTSKAFSRLLHMNKVVQSFSNQTAFMITLLQSPFSLPWSGRKSIGPSINPSGNS